MRRAHGALWQATRESLLAWIFAPGGKRGWHPAYPQWRKQCVIPMRYNRLVFYRSHLFHSAELPPQMSERTTMTFFLREPERKPVGSHTTPSGHSLT